MTITCLFFYFSMFALMWIHFNGHVQVIPWAVLRPWNWWRSFGHLFGFPPVCRPLSLDGSHDGLSSTHGISDFDRFRVISCLNHVTPRYLSMFEHVSWFSYCMWSSNIVPTFLAVRTHIFNAQVTLSHIFLWFSHGFLMVFPLRRCAFQPWCLTVMAPSLASWRWSAVEAAENFCRHRPRRWNDGIFV